MCEICKAAFEELKPFVAQLKQKYQGSVVVQDGIAHDVPPGHHVLMALTAAAQPYLVEEMRFYAEKDKAERGLGSFGFGNPKKDIAA